MATGDLILNCAACNKPFYLVNGHKCEMQETETYQCIEEPIGFLTQLREASRERSLVWTKGRTDITPPLFHATELGGEVGEALNIVKKLYRAENGMATSKATVEDLAEELADVIICVDLLAAKYDIDLEEAVRDKFNKTSDKYNLGVKL